MSSVIELDSVTFSYGKGLPTLDDVSLNVSRGEAVGLLGDSGSGKTTIAKILTGQLIPSYGECKLLGQVVGGLRSRSFSQIGAVQYVFQNPYASLEAESTVEQVLAEPVRLCKRYNYTDTLSAANALELVGFKPYKEWLDKRVLTLSGGQRQRLALARALVPRPKLLILDESTSMLDTATETEVISVIKQVIRSEGLSILLISHDLNLLVSACDSVHVLYDGKIVDSGSVSEVLNSPSHSYIGELIECMKFLRGERAI